MADLAAFAQQLGFTPEWFALGVVDEVVLTRLQREWNKGEDDNTEHYRYWAFSEFLKSNQPLTSELAAALFALGAADPDWSMGGSIMADIVYLSECPQTVLDAAMTSGRKHLVRIVERRQ